jgi:multiple sugar transport system permease protein
VHSLRLGRALDRNLGYILLLPACAFLFVFALYPVLSSIWMSLHRIILSLPQLGEPFVGLQNYRRLVSDPVARESFLFTFAFVVVSTFLELLLGLVMALVLNRSFPGRGAMRASVLIPWAIPTVVASQMWRYIFNDQYGLANLILFGADTSRYVAWLASADTARAAIILADVWKTSSFAGLLILAGLQMIPDELYEAARIDGAGAWATFRRITLPLLRPALLVALLFRTIDAFRVFGLVFVMTQGGPANSTSVLQFYGYKKMFTEGDMGYGAAVSVLVFLIILVISIGYIRAVGGQLMEEKS